MIFPHIKAITQNYATIEELATGAGNATVSNVISSPKTIAADTSYIVASYLKVDSDLTINGNLMVIG